MGYRFHYRSHYMYIIILIMAKFKINYAIIIREKRFYILDPTLSIIVHLLNR